MSQEQKKVTMIDAMLKLVRRPHVSEKSNTIADSYRQYTFEVERGASKPKIKAAVEGLFDVQVEAVAIVNVKGKARNFKQTKGRRRSWKKAYVTLKEGQTIDFENMGSM